MVEESHPFYDDLAALVAHQAEIIRDQREIISRQTMALAQFELRVSELEAEVAQLRKGGGSTPGGSLPPFVKPNKPAAERKPRKARDHGNARRIEAPTRVVKHTVERCPDCNRALNGGWVHRSRQIIEIPVVSYEVIEHQFFRRHCGVCGKDHIASPDLSSEAVGQHRLGVRLMALIVHLKKVGRMTVSGIQRLLLSLFGLRLAEGTVSEVLHAVARHGAPCYEELHTCIRESNAVHADETSWREDGRNHWMWVFSTQNARLFVEDKSRGHHVPKQVLGETFNGVLSSDFYAGYTFYLGEHQRCWVHFLRDLKQLREKYPHDIALRRWVKKIHKIWKSATEFSSEDRKTRVRARSRFQKLLVALAEPFAGANGADAVQRTLAQRVMRFVNEMFTFVEHPEVPSDNNPAERAIRPVVIYRKVTGGSRSEQGSTTTAVLMSLLSTWQLRNLDPMHTCVRMLQSATPQL